MTGSEGEVGAYAAEMSVGISAVTALLVAVVTSVLSRRRESEADWRKLRFEQYQEFVRALSGVVRGRATEEAQRRYADAANALSLVAPIDVIVKLQKFQKEISYLNDQRSDRRHDELLSDLLRAMRSDISPKLAQGASAYTFVLLSPPPGQDE
jgi:hypothetical protein